jgi:secreted PhoX family phosphatase
LWSTTIQILFFGQNIGPGIGIRQSRFRLGYVDVGWLVEIDPVTRQVMDYNNDGIKDKLWAMGRMSHENVVFKNDSLTAYFGEDGGTQCLYKFVANQK